MMKEKHDDMIDLELLKDGRGIIRQKTRRERASVGNYHYYIYFLYFILYKGYFYFEVVIVIGT